MEYKEFLRKKSEFNYDSGFVIDDENINVKLFDWQKAIVKWAVRKGRAALFEDCGLGKSFQQIEWARIISEKINKSALIICPLSVAEQTINEGKKLNVEIKYIKQETKEKGLFITNYEHLKDFHNNNFDIIVLDESSILKSIGGKTKNMIFELFNKAQYKLSCTATPSPNDISELGNQVQFLGIMSRAEMLSKFFINDAKNNNWRLKHHAHKIFYKWMATWSVFIRRPSDIGFSDEGYILPKLNIEAEYVDFEYKNTGELFPTTDIKGIQGRHEVRKQTFEEKIKKCAEDINKSNEQWIVWCGLNDEANMAENKIDKAVQVKGSYQTEKKNDIFNSFKKANIKVMPTKPKISGFGMNFQNSHNMAFIGIGDSFEQYYQCIRRQYRFGQKKSVNVKIYLTNAEQEIYKNVLKKEYETNKLYDEVVKEMQDFTKQELETGHISHKDKHEIKTVNGEGWTAHKGDVIETIDLVKDESVDMQIFSPPFFSLFTYSPSERDMGNNGSDDEFWEHFDYLIPKLYKKLKPGRICAVHCMDTPATIVKDGYIGLKDLRGDIIRHFEKHGYIYDGCAFIPKNPQAQSIRTRAKGLTFRQFEKDSTWSRPALPDYLVKFRKPGENKEPVENGIGKEVTRDEWIELASGIWNKTVRETYTLNTIKYPGDEAHVCPLQLDTIHNAVRLWSNPGDTIQTPFGGIGSEGYQSILDGRKAILHELKPEYFDQLCKNMEEAVMRTKEGMLIS